MNNQSSTETDRRVRVALGLMAFVLAMLGSQHIASGSAGPTTNQPLTTTFASASAANRWVAAA